MAIDVHSELFICQVIYFIAWILIEKSVRVTDILTLSQESNILFSGTIFQHLNVPLATRNEPHVQFITEVLRHHLDLILFEFFFKNIKIFGMEYHNCVFLGNYQNFAFLHLLAKCHSLGQLETIAFDPLAFGLGMAFDLFIDLFQSHKVQLVVKGEVKDQFLAFDISRRCLDVGFSPWYSAASCIFLFPKIDSFPKYISIELGMVD